MSRSPSLRYARALAELAWQAGKLDETGEELKEICGLLIRYPIIRSLFSPQDVHFRLGREQEALLFRRLLGSLELSELVRNFLLLLHQKDRLSLLPSICRHYQALSDKWQQRVRIDFITSHPLKEPEMHLLEEAFRRRLGKKVILTTRLDPSLLGGWMARVGESEIWDASLKGKLQQLKSKLLANEGRT